MHAWMQKNYNTLTSTLSLHNPQVGRSTSTQDLSFHWLEELSTFFYFLIGKSASTTILVGSPLYT
jgi:hypothetical protein